MFVSIYNNSNIYFVTKYTIYVYYKNKYLSILLEQYWGLILTVLLQCCI